MGNEASLQMEMGGMATNFDADEIKRLGKRFKKLDLDNSGSLSVEEFMSLPELQQNPLVQRVIDLVWIRALVYLSGPVIFADSENLKIDAVRGQIFKGKERGSW